MSANAGDARNVGSIPGLGRSLRVGYGNPVQHSCLENLIFRGVWQAVVHGVTKSWTQTQRLSMHITKNLVITKTKRQSG